ncbi:MAG: efflux transporter outer membrane subunit [Phycisphaerales bacterium]
MRAPSTIHRPLATIAVAALAIAACKVGPDYARPATSVPAQFRDGPDTTEPLSIADRPWWEVFDDPTLGGLIDQAIADNNDLRVAVARIEQARGLQMQIVSPLFPQIGYGGAVSRGRNEFLETPVPNGGQTKSSGVVALTAFWEIDLWGRIRRADEAALANILATEEARRAVLLSVVSETAQLYFVLLGLDLQLEIARQNAASFAETRRIFELRSRGGLDSDLAVSRASAAEQTVRAAIPLLERDIAIAENALNVILGRAPQPIARPRGLAEQSDPPSVPVGIPSQLLERRPDIRVREQEMIAANATVGVAIANYFPQLSLTAALGRVSPELSAFSAGTSNLWSIGAGLAGPIFQGGRLQGAERSARAAFEESVASYRQSVIVALKDVSDALVSREKLDLAEGDQAAAVGSLDRSVDVSTRRFLSGLASYFEVLEAQQLRFPAEQSLASTRTQKRLALVQLYRALGGGWNLSEEEWRRPTAPATAAAPTS